MKNKKLNNESSEDYIARLQEEIQKLKEELTRTREQYYNDTAYKTLAEKSKDGVLIIQDDKIKYLNTGFIELMGYKRDEVIDQPYEKFVPEEEWIELQNRTKSRLKGEKIPSVYETKMYNKKGKICAVELNVTMVEYKNKPAVIAAIRDITKLKKYETEGEKHLLFLSTLLNTLPVPVFYKNKQGFYEGCNKAFCEFTGIPENKLVGSSVFDLFEKELAETYYEADRQFLESGNEQVYETKAKNSTGEIRDLRFHKKVFKDTEGNISGFIGAFIDITEINLIRKDLEDKTHFLESIIRNLPLLIFTLDCEGNFTLGEGKGLDMLDLRKEYILGRNYSEVFESDENMLNHIKLAFEGQTSNCQNLLMGHYFETFYAPIINNDKIDGVIGVSLDITRRKKAEKEIQKYLAEMEESKRKLEEYSKELEESEQSLIDLNTRKDKFFSIISHDLRSPFNSLIGLSDFMVSEFKTLDSEELHEGLKSVNRNARNIFALLENLLEWAKIQMGRQEIDLKEVNLLALALNVIEVFKLSIQNKNLQLDITIDEDVHVFVDENMLNTAIRNIISNSVKFTPEKGKITLSNSSDKDYCELIISDSGIGIEKEQLDNLFEIDSLKSTPGLKGEKGSGLGLVLTKDLVEANGGTLSISSEINKGTTFRIKFPILRIN